MSIDPVERRWQVAFVDMLPEIQRRLRRAFRHLDPASREEATAEATALCLIAFYRLSHRGRAEVASASNLSYYAARQVKCGRLAAGRLNRYEPLSRYSLVENGIQAECHAWLDDLTDNTRWSVADQVAVRLDFRDWIRSLSARSKIIARDLACGFSTSEVAERHKLTPGRISQLRRELHQGWRIFQGETKAVA